MITNVGTTDRIIRTILGFGIIAIAAVSHGAMRWIGVVGAVLLLTALFRFCAAYALFGIKTCRTQSKLAAEP